jgi:F-type H+-transporting ATPase subunit epsilon
MDAVKIDLEIVTPERLVLAATVDEVVLPGCEGYLGVLPGHAPLLTALMEGELTYRIGGRTSYLAVSGGFVEVLPYRVSVVAEACERAEEIDLERAQQALDKARAAIARSDLSDAERREAESGFRRATARLQAGRRGRS